MCFKVEGRWGILPQMSWMPELSGQPMFGAFVSGIVGD